MMRADKSLDKETQDLMRQALTEAFRPLRDTLVVQNKSPLRLPPEYKYADAKPKDVVPGLGHVWEARDPHEGVQHHPRSSANG